MGSFRPRRKILGKSLGKWMAGARNARYSAISCSKKKYFKINDRFINDIFNTQCYHQTTNKKTITKTITNIQITAQH